MTTLGATIIVIGVIVFIHELGHYLAARMSGIRVEKFSVGFPPRFITFTSIENGWDIRLYFFRRSDNGKTEWGPIWNRTFSSRKRKGSNTEYCIALIPFGGYVKMAGIIDESMDMSITHAPDEFMSKSSLTQIFVMSAGVIMNVLLAFVILTGIAWNNGTPELSNEPVIARVIDNMPAKLEGMKVGDRILSINEQSIETWEELSNIIHGLPNSLITLTYERDGKQYSKTLTTKFQPVLINGKIDTLGAIGIIQEYTMLPIGFVEALKSGIVSTIGGFELMIVSIKMLVTGEASIKELGGPIMIAKMAGDSARAGLGPLLYFMALISLNLALLNILPIPGLDGGHIFITLIQMIIRRPISMNTRLAIQKIGLALILLLMITVFINDIGRIISN